MLKPLDQGFIVGPTLLQIPPTNFSFITYPIVAQQLGNLIGLGFLPQPDWNTYYAVHFAENVPFYQFGTAWCSYHEWFNYTMPDGTMIPVPYGVIPDNKALYSVNNTGCGTNWGDLTNYASHEFVEAVTDPYNFKFGHGQLGGWFTDASGGKMGDEIADLCAWIECSYNASGTTYTIQEEWDNVNNDCACPPQ